MVMAMFRLRVRVWRVLFFFFQAEDGIRDVAVTGVQTCALPIYTPANFTSRVMNSAAMMQMHDREHTGMVLLDQLEWRNMSEGTWRLGPALAHGTAQSGGDSGAAWQSSMCGLPTGCSRRDRPPPACA